MELFTPLTAAKLVPQETPQDFVEMFQPVHKETGKTHVLVS
jgi:hypothetical protein